MFTNLDYIPKFQDSGFVFPSYYTSECTTNKINNNPSSTICTYSSNAIKPEIFNKLGVLINLKNNSDDNYNNNSSKKQNNNPTNSKKSKSKKNKGHSCPLLGV